MRFCTLPPDFAFVTVETRRNHAVVSPVRLIIGHDNGVLLEPDYYQNNTRGTEITKLIAALEDRAPAHPVEAFTSVLLEHVGERCYFELRLTRARLA